MSRGGDGEQGKWDVSVCFCRGRARKGMNYQECVLPGWEQENGQMELSQERTSVYWLLGDSRGSNFSSTSLTLTPVEAAL